MLQMIFRNASSRIFILLMFSMISYINYIYIKGAFASVLPTESYNDGAVFLILEVIGIIYLLSLKKIQINKMQLLSLAFICIQSFTILCDDTSNSLALIVRTIIWVVLLIVFSKIAQYKLEITDEFIWLFSTSIIIFSIIITINQIIAYRITPNIRYTIVYLLLTGMPLVFLAKSRSIKIILILTVGCAVTFSAKGAAIFTYISCLMVAGIISNFLGKKYVQKVIKFIIAIVALYLIVPLANDFIIIVANFDWYNRFTSLLNSGGSGRLEFWNTMITKQVSSNVFEWIFGHGYNSTKIFLHGHTAHNDFIEVLFDYGLIGLAIYLNFFIKMFVYMKRSIKFNESNLTIAIGSMITIFLSLSMVSHMIIYPLMMINIGVFWGICNGKISRICENEHKKQLIRNDY